MNSNILKMYINKLDRNDIKMFFIKENINVNNEEFEYLFNILKNDYGKILNNDKNIINDIKNNINNDAYNKLLNLLNKYKTYI